MHLVIPDTQARPGAPTDHLAWIGQYIVDRYAGKPIKIIHLGDHWDFPSLSSYDKKGSHAMEGRRFVEDLEAGIAAWGVLTGPMDAYNATRRAYKEAQWAPERHRLIGNHEARLTRAIETDPQLIGLMSLDMLKTPGWQVHDFLEPVELDGIRYSHFFVNTANGRPDICMNETRIKTIGCSFVQGHQQGLKAGMLETLAGRRRGIVAGSCYLTAETYRGPQATGEWRGILVLNEVDGSGDFDLMEVSLNYLCHRYEGKSLERFLAKKYGGWAAA